MSGREHDPRRLPLLLEIGTQEIPARFIPGSMQQLQALTAAALAEAQLGFAGLRVYATPRRLALLIEALDVRQPDRMVELKGPPVSAAFDAQGLPTPAALGFARKAQVALKDCARASDQRGEILVARRREPGSPAAEVLAQALPRIVLQLSFRKTMRWGDYEVQYPRPLEWVVALLGPQVIDLKIDYLAAGRATRGHRTLAGDEPLPLDDPGRYLQVMRAAGVIADPQERRDMILAGIARELAAYSPRAGLVLDEELLQEIVFLCEHPTPFLGSIGEEFFALPDQVITTALKSHQRYFTVKDRGTGGLLPRFAAVRDGGERSLPTVVAGNERVLRARLADALFYWNFDQRRSPSERALMLGAVTWLEGFGSVLDKTRRLQDLCRLLWTSGLGLGAQAPAALLRAAELAKSDLVSEMIKDGKEFTKLEGFIGARYAERAGEDPQVCRAIERHLLPKAAADELPADDLSSCLSLADRLDTLAGCWLAGFVPTGAKDPYALRRHTLAAVRILLERGWRLDLPAWLQAALDGFAGFAEEPRRRSAHQELAEFVRTRLAGHFQESLGMAPEVVRAVVPVRWSDPVDAVAWIRALQGYRSREDFRSVATGFKRCRNILKGDLLPVQELNACLQRWLAGGRGAGGESFDDLSEPAEVRLRRQAAAGAQAALAAERAGDYDGVFAVLSQFGPVIDDFFGTVRVNVEDERLRAVRTAFLREIHGLFARYGDFAEMAPVDS